MLTYLMLGMVATLSLEIVMPLHLRNAKKNIVERYIAHLINAEDDK